ncbi:flagellar hook-basal body complex protein FliE [Bacillus tianshenii]|nr:flagellar hook-basal body complex protein FliE [Bacillus tianshenii]
MNKVGFQATPNIMNTAPKKVTPAQAQSQFSTAFKEALEKANETLVQSDVTTDKFIKGEIKDLHEVMIASQKASVTRTLTIEVRDKAVEAYREIMRMQV